VGDIPRLVAGGWASSEERRCGAVEVCWLCGRGHLDRVDLKLLVLVVVIVQSVGDDGSGGDMILE